MILVEQVSEFTEGSISKQVLKIALALGVSIAAGLSILRVFTGTPFMYYVIVGYGISLILMFFITYVERIKERGTRMIRLLKFFNNMKT